MKAKIKYWLLLPLVMVSFMTYINSCSNDDEEEITTLIKDADGNTYTTITIGTQVWLKENLKTTKYNDGTAIPLVTDNTEWANLMTPGFSWFDNNASANKNVYGGLYNWYAINTGKLCPAGLHVPSDAEWTTLTTYLGGENLAGGKLKETGTAHWNSPNTGATNSTGFTALPGANRQLDGNFFSTGETGNWWSSTELSATTAWYRYMTYDNANVGRVGFSKNSGYSVRCIKD